MTRLVDSCDAAALWGCTRRHIQWLATHGELTARGWKVIHYPLGTDRMMSQRVPLYDAAEVMALRTLKKRSKAEHGRRMLAKHGKQMLRSTQRLSRIWHTMPASERAKWGSNWRTGALAWERGE